MLNTKRAPIFRLSFQGRKFQGGNSYADEEEGKEGCKEKEVAVSAGTWPAFVFGLRTPEAFLFFGRTIDVMNPRRIHARFLKKAAYAFVIAAILAFTAGRAWQVTFSDDLRAFYLDSDSPQIGLYLVGLAMMAGMARWAVKSTAGARRER